jgi:hypothetical protein
VPPRGVRVRERVCVCAAIKPSRINLLLSYYCTVLEEVEVAKKKIRLLYRYSGNICAPDVMMFVLLRLGKSGGVR